MKKALFLAFFSCFFSIGLVKAQLSFTHWKGVLNIPDPVHCLLDFRRDELVVYNVERDPGFRDSVWLETMSYTLVNGELTVQKIRGSSPCDNSMVAKYKVEMKEDKLYFILLEDGCEARKQAWTEEPFTKAK